MTTTPTAPAASETPAVRWSAGEAVALLIGCQFVAAALVVAAIGVHRSSTLLIALTPAMVALCAISVTVWLNLRKERLGAD
nr:hypothetical protein KPHV_29790 [Kitasatospora purpeofusca]